MREDNLAIVSACSLLPVTLLYFEYAHTHACTYICLFTYILKFSCYSRELKDSLYKNWTEKELLIKYLSSLPIFCFSNIHLETMTMLISQFKGQGEIPNSEFSILGMN